MSTSVHTNMEAIRTHNTYTSNLNMQNKTMQRIATGLRINSAGDNASGWAISEKMRERLRSLDQVNQNIQNDTSMVRTAEGGLANTIEILRTMKERALDAANDSNKDTDRAIIQKEIDSLIKQIDANANVKYNGKSLINGSTFKTGETEAGLKGVFVHTGITEAGGTLAQDAELSTVGSIASTDKFTISWVRNGTFSSRSGEVGNNKLTDLFINEIGSGEIGGTFVTAGAEVGTIKGIDGLALKSPFAGYAFYTQEYGFSNDITYMHIEITGADGTTKDADTALLNNGWVNIQAAQDEGKGNPLTFRIGEETSMSIAFGNMTSEALGIKGINLSTKEAASAAAGAFDTALNRALEEQTKIGALENRLGYTADNITTATENVQASDSAIRDADMAKEMSDFMKWSVLGQASQLMLAQAGQNAYSVLQLLQP